MNVLGTTTMLSSAATAKISSVMGARTGFSAVFVTMHSVANAKTLIIAGPAKKNSVKIVKNQRIVKCVATKTVSLAATSAMNARHLSVPSAQLRRLSSVGPARKVVVVLALSLNVVTIVETEAALVLLLSAVNARRAHVPSAPRPTLVPTAGRRSVLNAKTSFSAAAVRKRGNSCWSSYL